MMINPQHRSSIIVVDDFFADPHAVRNFALKQSFEYNNTYHKGKRTRERFLWPGIKETFESLLRKKITEWETHVHNGVFQVCTSSDPIVYHSDLQTYAATIYLTPEAPLETGLTTLQSRVTGVMREPQDDETTTLTYTNNLLDVTKWNQVDKIGNVFNRLVVFDAKLLHAASSYFGHSDETGRLFQIFFFDAV